VPIVEPPLTGTDMVSPSESEDAPAKRMRKPSYRIRDILDGHGTASYRSSDPVIAPGIQLPTTVNQDVVLEGEGSADWMMIAEATDEYALVAETSEVEAIEPRSLAEARCCPDWELWEKGILEELVLLKEAGTWELTIPLENANIVGSKWVFHTKKDAAGNVVCYKACLVAQGFSQVPGVDYFDTFAPVTKLALIQSVLALAAAKDMEIHQIDIKGAYLNGELTDQETIYMAQPPGYHAPNSTGKVCHLQKTLYGLKQSGRCWYQKLIDIMTKHLAFS
jgi:Reverse transcriptase (RNA-dependent DNA polymerase)